MMEHKFDFQVGDSALDSFWSLCDSMSLFYFQQSASFGGDICVWKEFISEKKEFE